MNKFSNSVHQSSDQIRPVSANKSDPWTNFGSQIWSCQDHFWQNGTIFGNQSGPGDHFWQPKSVRGTTFGQDRFSRDRLAKTAFALSYRVVTQVYGRGLRSRARVVLHRIIATVYRHIAIVTQPSSHRHRHIAIVTSQSSHRHVAYIDIVTIQNPTDCRFKVWIRVQANNFLYARKPVYKINLQIWYKPVLNANQLQTRQITTGSIR